MSELDVPEMAVAPRRFASPHPAFARAKIEPVHEALYSSLALNIAIIPPEVPWFQYAIGGTVSGAGIGATIASLIHTNMDTPSALPMPRLHLVTGIRVVVVSLTAALTAALQLSSSPDAPAADVSFDDLRRILYGTLYSLHIGTKNYLRVPLWMVPGNVGMGGISELSYGADNDNLDAALTESSDTSFKNVQIHTEGKYFHLNRFPILIPSQQNFFSALSTPQTVAPTLIGTRLLVNHLDGISGREVQ